MKLNPYLTLDGQCEAAFTFYAQCLGGKIEMMLTFKDAPSAENIPAHWLDKIMHARLVLGDQVLMGSDSPPQFQEPMKGFSVSLAVDEPAEAERIFQALEKGGTVRMPMQQTFWAERFGMVTDRFGVPWMINCQGPAQV
ncbi:MAG: VOC family protein [Deltaproteobacteria bacterium]|nr:VOC family protein [Deltaproteobacteria bacterium]